MHSLQDKLRLATIVLLCFVNLGFGLFAGQTPMILGGAVGMVYVAATAVAGHAQATHAIDARP